MIKGVLEIGFEAPVWVEGEVSGARPAASGHLYFCLRDDREEASLDAVMYKTSLTPAVRKLVVDGARIRLRGRPTFWPPRGRLQFVADKAEAVGRGALLEALEKLKAKLTAEGLFALERKRPLPPEPRVIGVVTSAGGAVIHDVCKVAFRRGGARILLAPALVQGAGAAESIRRALELVQRVADVDVVIVGRGGGSADELSVFNDEALVRAVAACRVPVVSAVGHEVDITLTDFAADVRASTPSQAAELCVPDRRARAALLEQKTQRLLRAVRARVTEDRVALGDLMRAIGDPRLVLAEAQQRLDERRGRLEDTLRTLVAKKRSRSHGLAERLAYVHPRAVIGRERTSLLRAEERIRAAGRKLAETRRAMLERQAGRLDAMSPLKVLGRGYALATNEGGHAIRSSSDVRIGERVTIRVAEASFGADVVSVEPGGSERRSRQEGE
jgi:exodeoxyribonuclease VII large subunit